MSNFTVGRLQLAPPSQWHEQTGDPVTNLGGAPVPSPRSALRHAVSLDTFAPDSVAADTVAARDTIRRQIRAILNNTPLKLQGYLYVQYGDDPEQSGWYVPDQGSLNDGDGASGIATGWWKLESVVWMLAGHKRTHREARNIWMKDQRTGLFWRDTLKYIYSTDFAFLPALQISFLPHGTTSAVNTVSAGVVVPVAMPVGRDGGICGQCSGLADLACISYERPESAMNRSDVICYDRRGSTVLPEAQYENWIINPSFEYDANGTATPIGWNAAAGMSLNGGATISVVNTQHAVGAQALQITTTNSVAAQGAHITSSQDFVAGVVYKASVWMKGNAGGELVQLQLGSTADDSGSSNATLTTSFVQYTVTWTPTANRSGSTHGLALRTQGATALTFFADAAMIVPGTSTNYFDGDTAGCGWLGIPGASPSLMPPAFNLVPDPSFEYDAIGGSPKPCWRAGTIAADATAAGSRALTVTASTAFLTGLQTNGVNAVSAIPGAAYSINALFNATQNTTNNLRCDVFFRNSVGAPIGSAAATQTYVGTGAMTFSATNLVAPATTAFVDISWTAAGGTVTLFVDAAIITQSDLAVTYDDGDSAGWMWKGTVGNSVSVQAVDPVGDEGWEETEGPDYPWNWMIAGQPNDAPVLENGLVRVRYDASVGVPGFRVDVFNGTSYAEQGKMVVERLGDANGFCNTFVSAGLHTDNGYTPDRATMLVVLANSADANSRERIYITVQRGQFEVQFECYPAIKADGVTQADAIMSWTPALNNGVGDLNNSFFKVDSVGNTSLPNWTPGLPNNSQSSGPVPGRIVSTAGTGAGPGNSGPFTSAHTTLGSGNQSTSENWAGLLRYPTTYNVTGPWQVTFAVVQATNATFQYTFENNAYGISGDTYYVRSQNAAGYIQAQLNFGPTQAQQVLEAELMTPGAATTSVADATASGGNTTTSTRVADAIHVSQATWPNSFLAQYRVFARVKTTANTGSFYAKTSATTGTTVTVSGATTPGYQWVDLGDIVANASTLEIHAWVSVGSGQVEVDRIEAIATQDRARNGAIFSGARDQGQDALFDARQLGAVVSR